MRDVVGNRVDGTRRAIDGQRIAFAVHGSKPQGIGAADGIGDGFEKFLAAGAVPLERLDDADPLLQDGSLLFEIVHLLLQLFEPRLFTRLFLDVRRNLGILAIQQQVVPVKGAEAHDQRNREQDILQRGLERHRGALGFRPRSAK